MNNPLPPNALTNATNPVEQLMPGLTREWLHNGQIVVYTLNDVHRETADAWAEAFEADLLAWSSDQPFSVIHDLRNSGITPYGRARAQTMFKMRPDATLRVALILPANIASDLIQLFVRTQAKPARNRLRKFFHSREEAINWQLTLRDDKS